MFIAAFGALAYLAAAVGADSARLLSALQRLGWGGCALVLSLSVANYLLRFVRWQHYIGLFGHRLPGGQHLLVYLSGFALTVSPGKGGEAVRSLYMRDHGVSYSESIAALFVERLLDALAMVFLAGFLLIDDLRYAPYLGAALAGVGVVLIVLGRDEVALKIETLAGRRTGRIARALFILAGLLKSSHRLLQPAPVFVGLALALLAWGAEGVGLYFVLNSLQAGIGVSAATGIYAIAALAGAVAFFMPGGIGGMEVAMTTLIVSRGATLPVALIATLVCRLATLWFAVLIGILATVAVEALAVEARRERKSA